MKWSLNVLISHSSVLKQCITGGDIWKSMSFYLCYFWEAVVDSLSSLIYSGLISLVIKCPWRSLKIRMNSLYDITFMGQIKMIFLSYSYKTNLYLFPLFEVTGNRPVRYVVISLLWLIILVKSVLVRCVSGFIVDSYIGSCCLVDLMLLLVWCMWPLEVFIDGGICLLIRSIFKLGHVAK